MTQSEKKKNLGRGLSSLLGVNAISVNQPPEFITQDEDPHGVQMIRITDIRPGKYQPRSHFDREELEGLSLSIRENGIIQPIILRPLPSSGENVYEIIAGERRWRAAEMSGLEWLPCIIRELTDIRALEIALIENIQRKDLMALEEAEAYQRLMEEFGHTQEELSKIIGKSRSHVANTLRLNSLPASVKLLLNEGSLSAGHVRAIIGLENIEELAQQIADSKSNVREVELIAKAIKRKMEEPKEKSESISMLDAELAPLIQKLQEVFQVPVKIKARGNKGEVIFSYTSLSHLDRLMKIADVVKF